jgi:hypothetical protein
MEHLKVSLIQGCCLRIYVIDGAFVNETEADSFKWNEFAGAENSVLEV